MPTFIFFRYRVTSYTWPCFSGTLLKVTLMYASHFSQGTWTTRPCLSGRVIIKSIVYGFLKLHFHFICNLCIPFKDHKQLTIRNEYSNVWYFIQQNLRTNHRNRSRWSDLAFGYNSYRSVNKSIEDPDPYGSVSFGLPEPDTDPVSEYWAKL